MDTILKEVLEIKELIKNTPQALPIAVPEIIDSKELCKRLGLSRPTLITWRKKKKIPFIKIGTSIRYNWPTVVAYLDNCKLQPIKKESIVVNSKIEDYIIENDPEDICACCGIPEPLCGTYGIDRPHANKICLKCQDLLKKKYKHLPGYSFGEMLYLYNQEKGIENLSDQYCTNRIKSRSQFSIDNSKITPELIELVRANIKLKRELKNLKQ